MSDIDRITQRIRDLGRPRGESALDAALNAVVNNPAVFCQVLNIRREDRKSGRPHKFTLVAIINEILLRHYGPMGGAYGPRLSGIDQARKEIDRRLVAEILIFESLKSIEDEEKVTEREAPLHQKSSLPAAGPRLELDQARELFRVDSRWIQYGGGDATIFLKRLLKYNGEMQPGHELVANSRPERVFKSLPQEIKFVIESRRGSRGGYRINPEYLSRLV